MSDDPAGQEGRSDGGGGDAPRRPDDPPSGRESDDSAAVSKRSRAAGDAPEGGEDAGPPARVPAERPRTPVTQQIGRVVVALLLVLFGVFAVANAHRVAFSWVFGATEVTQGPTGEATGGVPLIVLLLAAFAIGAVVGAMVAWQRARVRRRAERPGAEDSGSGG